MSAALRHLLTESDIFLHIYILFPLTRQLATIPVPAETLSNNFREDAFRISTLFPCHNLKTAFVHDLVCTCFKSSPIVCSAAARALTMSFQVLQPADAGVS